MKNLFILLFSFFALSVTAQTANYTHTISRTDAKRFEENESHIYDIGIDTLTGSNDTLLIQFDRTFPAFYGITYTGVLAASSTSTTLKAELLGRNKSSETWVIIDDVNVTTEGSTTTLTADLNYMYLALRYVSSADIAHVNSTILLKKKSSSASSGGGPSYLVYTALLTQSGTDAPTAVVLENTLGFTPTYAYNSAGTYQINQTNGWTTNKTACFVAPAYDDGAGCEAVILASYPSDDTITLKSWSCDITNHNDIMINTLVEIRIYP